MGRPSRVRCDPAQLGGETGLPPARMDDAQLPKRWEIASTTLSKLGGRRTGGFLSLPVTPGIEPSWYFTLNSVNLRPLAVETHTTFSPFLMTLRLTSFARTARPTAVCGQVYMPVRSARAAASHSSSSLACSTMPLSSSSAKMARGALTGLPIWIAVACVGLAAIGVTTRLPSLQARYSGLAFSAWATTKRGY